MKDMNDEKNFESLLNAGELLKKSIITALFKTINDSSMEQKPIFPNDYKTSFTIRCDILEGLLWKYTPLKVQNAIKQIHQDMELSFEKIDADESLNDTNRTFNKTKICYKSYLEIMKILSNVVMNSSLMTEYMTGDFGKIDTSEGSSDD